MVQFHGNMYGSGEHGAIDTTKLVTEVRTEHAKAEAELVEIIDALANQIDYLTRVLAPVLLPERPSGPDVATVEAMPECSDATMFLRERARAVETLDGRLHRLSERLDV